ncbi:MFS transporter [Motilibacter aurantiacus]|uniref:MFS transporter n=1 Tax=Motilibacter aurantiacus TaxID=2714955 RepID=UPI00140BC09E|nr:MFS transporter [Motilibacter aurantiacus]NHC46187.1 MFS transporter [Motilibacter aurantiacus]
MLGPYRDVLAVPGARGFSAAAFLARLPISMEALAVLFLVESTTGRYASAAAVSAVLAVCTGASAPFIGRAADRRGQGWVLRRAPFVRAAALVGLVSAALADLPLPVLLLLAALAGSATAQPGSLVRSRWSHVLAGRPALLHTAYSLESALDELIFVLGPVGVTLLATQVDPVAGVLLPVAALLLGTSALARQRATEPPPHPATADQPAGTVIGRPPLALLTVVFLLMGGVFGAAEVIAVAFTEERGQPSAAGWVLGAFAVSSMVSGLVWGVLHWRSSLVRRFLVAAVAFGAASLTFPFASESWVLAALLCASGFAISPSIISGLALAGELAPVGKGTEALTWVTTGITFGAAAAGAVAGPLIDAHGAQAALWVCSGAGASSALLALVCAPMLTRAAAAARPAAVRAVAGGAPVSPP